LKKYQDEFIFPQINGKGDLFHWKFIGITNSKRTKAYVDEVMNDWQTCQVEGHFTVKTMVGLSR
jgi:kynureninase